MQVADRHAQLVGLVLRALQGSLATNCTLRSGARALTDLQDRVSCRVPTSGL